MKLLLLAILGTLCLTSALETYEDYKVFRVWPKNEEKRSFLRSLEGSWTELDFWRVSKTENTPTDIMVHKKDQEKFIEYMKNEDMVPEIFIDDLQKRMRAERVGKYSRSGMNWNSYFRLDDIYAWFDELAAADSRVSVVVGGSTSEGTQIKGLKINNGSGKKAVFLEGGIHAREWISPATVTYLANSIINDTDFRKISDSFNWYLFPVINPDGYEFSHVTARLWRKTRTIYSDMCYGADANRNWDAHWMEQGTDDFCLSDIYGGTQPFSEPGIATLSEYIRSISSELVSYISFHSYSQLLMVPYGHTTAHLDNYSETVAIGEAAITALAARYGTKYSPVGNIAETIYAASGGSIDWVKQEFGTPLVYIYELSDNGTYGFVLPAFLIIPNCLEVQDSIVAMFQEAANRGIVTLS